MHIQLYLPQTTPRVVSLRLHAALCTERAKLSGSEVTIDAPREVRIASARVEIP